MTLDELVSLLAETLLWEVTSAEVEKTKYLTDMLKDINYLDDKEKKIKSVLSCEVLDSEDFIVNDYNIDNNEIIIFFEMNFILISSNSKEQLLRTTASSKGTYSVRNEPDFWEQLNLSNLNRLELLELKHLVKLNNISFFDAECDDLTALGW